jgi:hypothetical protein
LNFNATEIYSWPRERRLWFVERLERQKKYESDEIEKSKNKSKRQQRRTA